MDTSLLPVHQTPPFPKPPGTKIAVVQPIRRNTSTSSAATSGLQVHGALQANVERPRHVWTSNPVWTHEDAPRSRRTIKLTPQKCSVYSSRYSRPGCVYTPLPFFLSSFFRLRALLTLCIDKNKRTLQLHIRHSYQTPPENWPYLRLRLRPYPNPSSSRLAGHPCPRTSRPQGAVKTSKLNEQPNVERLGFETRRDIRRCPPIRAGPY